MYRIKIKSITIKSINAVVAVIAAVTGWDFCFVFLFCGGGVVYRAAAAL